jgi:hypothetical protein
MVLLPDAEASMPMYFSAGRVNANSAETALLRERGLTSGSSRQQEISE